MDIGFIGLGRMGSAMAANLAKAGHRVIAWNRSPATVDGVEMVASPQDALQADVAFTMLADDRAIRAVLLDDDALARARPGLVHVVSATISLALVEELTGRHAALGIGYVAAPVFGRPDAAAAAQLNIVAAGSEAAVAKVQPLLDVIGRQTWVIGTEPRQANAVKIAGNMMIALALEAMGEGVALTEAVGVEAKAFLDIMTATLFGARAYTNYAPNIVDRAFTPGFTMTLGLKDVRLAVEAAGRPLPLLGALEAQMAAAVAAGLGESDWSALADFTRRATQPG